jgi:hypothetical protein
MGRRRLSDVPFGKSGDRGWMGLGGLESAITPITAMGRERAH